MSRQKRALRSGGLVAANHVVSAGITAASAILLSKALGPGDFAIYVLCMSMSGVLRVVSRLGISVSLLTRREPPTDEDYGTALSAMLLASVVVAVLGGIALPSIARFSHIAAFVGPGAVTVALLPLFVLPLPAVTRMERDLNFRPVILIELFAQILGQCVGIGLAFAGWGVWGPIVGAAIRATILAVSPWVVLRRWPGLHWNGINAFQMMRYGVGYLIATSLIQGRTFLILAVVGRAMGQQTVGYMGLALRAVGLIAPFRAAVSRVILPALAPIADLPEKLRKGVADVVETEMLFSIPVTVLAVTAFGPAVHIFLGDVWAPAARLFPWVAAAAVLASVHATALSALHVRGFFIESVASTLASYLAVTGALFALVSRGPEAPGMAMLGLWPAAWLGEWLAHRRLETSWSRNGLVWAIGGAGACLAWRFGPVMLLFPAICWGATYYAIRQRAHSTLATLTDPTALPEG